MKIFKVLIIIILFASLPYSAYPVVISVIDSGLEVNNSFIKDRVWRNYSEIADNEIDDDLNGYIDDLFGWNFVRDNNMVFDERFRGFFNQDHERFINLQTKVANDTTTVEEIAWLKQKSRDRKFITEVMAYGNYIHGTHVAGIVVNKSAANQIEALKIIETSVRQGPTTREEFLNSPESKDLRVSYQMGLERGLQGLALVKYMLYRFVNQQMAQMARVIHYVDVTHAVVANASFGTEYSAASKMVLMLYKIFLQETPSASDLKFATGYFFDQVLTRGQEIFGKASRTLFVFAAGNDSSDNDIYPASPTNLRLDNTIAVAALDSNTTYGSDRLAKFSNFGKSNVDVVAPGVSVVSSIPENKLLAVSGTSQAAPFVSNIAGEVLNLNPLLSPQQVKQIIIGTVDVRLSLRGLVASSGVVNKDRAMLAAKYSKNYPLKQAILMAKEDLKSMPPIRTARRLSQQLDFVLPLVSEFSIMNI
ncbi:MAG: S8 family serine peptidase [Oligoflexia bacterium]|nr:S8 family serine peptidase [Oligoflexia bacterium]